MRFLVIAEPEPQFAAWGTGQRQPARAPVTGSEQRGLRLFLENTCVNCHSIRGASAASNVAPDLTHLGSRRTLAADVLKNTLANLARWLKDPQAVKPACKMPNLNLTDAQVNDLASYLEGRL
jgi:cytochrome c oxidase subunit II